MSTKPIVMTFYQNDGLHLSATPAFEITYKGNKYLEKACWWLLLKTFTLTNYFVKTQIVKQVRIDPDKAIREIVAMASTQLRMLGKKPERILLGREQFNKICSDMLDHRHSFEFSIPFEDRQNYGPYHSGVRLYNIPVQVIPWMDGVLVL